jgi:putative cardiolipin synthase
LLQEGIDALALRLLLAKFAERSIDAQYFYIQRDLSGHLFINALLNAADRGVRVRLLIDDILTIGFGPDIAALESHPNIEVRIFNPFARRSSARSVEFFTDLGRVNHRMHNKSFTVDNQATIVGGRNIGDAYFDAERDLQYGDLDVIGLGPVAKEISEGFDVYWNFEAAVPAEAIVGQPDDADALPELRDRMASVVKDASQSQYGEALISTILNNMGSAQFPLYWGDPIVVYDDPEKILDSAAEDVPTIRSQLRSKVLAAAEELLIVSPYFVPQERGIDAFRELRERGVRTLIVTNSLASTDEIAVHAHYARYRKELLELGVELYEVKPDTNFQESKRSGYAFSLSALHAKAFIVDRRYIFIGSFNWDPRSVDINTEIGIYLDAEPMASSRADTLFASLDKHAYRLRLDDDGDIEWVDSEETDEVLFAKEPQVGFWRRFQAGFYRILPIEGQL